MSYHPVGYERRLQQLTDDSADDATLLAAYRPPEGETPQGYYYLTLRVWQRDDPTLSTVSIAYAYLTKGDGHDGWDKNFNMRVSTDEVADFLGMLTQMFAAAQPRVDADADPLLLPEEE